MKRVVCSVGIYFCDPPFRLSRRDAQRWKVMEATTKRMKEEMKVKKTMKAMKVKLLLKPGDIGYLDPPETGRSLMGGMKSLRRGR